MKATQFRIPYRPLVLGLLALAPGLFVPQRAHAGGDHYYPPVSEVVVAEKCSSCHLAFPAAMLPARSWQKMMGKLADHFGDDASVDAASAARIARYFTDNAADRKGADCARGWLRGMVAGATPQRITELPRWVRKHDDVGAWEWKHPEVRSKANCAACHQGAERGWFDDD